MSGAYSIFPLRLVVVFNLTTYLIRNALAVSPLAVGIAAVDRIRPLGGKGFSAPFANLILAFFQPPLLQILLITPVPAQMIIAIFLTGNLGVEHTPTALADNFPHSRVRPYPGELFFIPLLQRFLIFIFPIAVPHGIFPSFHRSGRPSIPDPPIPFLYGFCFLLLPIPHFAVRFPLASLTAVFHIASGGGKCFSAVSVDAFAAPACRRFLPVEFRPAVRAAEQSVQPRGFKFFPTAFADQLERLTDSVFAGLDLLIALPALDAVPVQGSLPLFFLRHQLRGREVEPPDEFQIDVHLLRPVAVYLFWGMDDDLINKFVDHRRSQFREIGVLFRQGEEPFHIGGVLLEAVQRRFCLRDGLAARIVSRISVRRALVEMW